jgi:hypothetical protein
MKTNRILEVLKQDMIQGASDGNEDMKHSDSKHNLWKILMINDLLSDPNTV